VNAGGKRQTPRKAAHALRNEVGQNIKDEKTKELGTETRPGEEVVKEEKFPNRRKPSLIGESVGSFGISEDNITEGGWGVGVTRSPQNMHLTATPRGEVVQTLGSATSEQGLDRKVRVACLG